MDWRTENDFDDESITILEISATFLEQYFDHSEGTANQLITSFFRKYDIPDVESYLTHQLSWKLAKEIHFTMALNGDRDAVLDWSVENQLQGTPREALAYLRENYWSKDFPSVRWLTHRDGDG